MSNITILGIEISEVTQWPFWVQSTVVGCLLLLALFSRFSSDEYSKRVFLVLNALLALLAVYYAFGANDFAAGGFFALIAGAGFYLHRKTKPVASFKNLLLVWLLSVIGIIIYFGMFEGVFFTEEIRVNRPIRLPVMEWYIFWGVFALGAIAWLLRYIKRTPLPKWESYGNAIGIIILAFWGTYFFFNTFDAYHRTYEYVKHDAFDEVTADIRFGFGIDAKNKYGQTLLLKAVQDGDFEEVKRLVEKGADVNVRGGRVIPLKTPLIMSIYKGHFDIFSYLIKNGANVNSGADVPHMEEKYLPLQMAVSRVNDSDLRYVMSLIENGADINARGVGGMQAIHSAAEGASSHKGEHYSRTGVIELLVEKGADVNAKANLGTPLHYAVFGGDLVAFKKLIELGANPALTNSGGLTPLQSAKKLVNLNYGKLSEVTRKNNERRRKIIEYLEGLDNEKRLN
jgi:ankyrin repeat protein